MEIYDSTIDIAAAYQGVKFTLKILLSKKQLK